MGEQTIEERIALLTELISTGDYNLTSLNESRRRVITERQKHCAEADAQIKTLDVALSAQVSWQVQNKCERAALIREQDKNKQIADDLKELRRLAKKLHKQGVLVVVENGVVNSFR